MRRWQRSPASASCGCHASILAATSPRAGWCRCWRTYNPGDVETRPRRLYRARAPLNRIRALSISSPSNSRAEASPGQRRHRRDSRHNPRRHRRRTSSDRAGSRATPFRDAPRQIGIGEEGTAEGHKVGLLPARISSRPRSGEQRPATMTVRGNAGAAPAENRAAPPEHRPSRPRQYGDGRHRLSCRACAASRLVPIADYQRFLSWLYRRKPGLEGASYDAQMAARNASLFGVADFYSRNLAAAGHIAADIHVNNPWMRAAWAREHRLAVDAAATARRLGAAAMQFPAGCSAPSHRSSRCSDRSRARSGLSPRLDAEAEKILLAQIEEFKPDLILNRGSVSCRHAPGAQDQADRPPHPDRPGRHRSRRAARTGRSTTS